MYRCIDRYRCFYLYFQLKKQPFLKAPFRALGKKIGHWTAGIFRACKKRTVHCPNCPNYSLRSLVANSLFSLSSVAFCFRRSMRSRACWWACCIWNR